MHISQSYSLKIPSTVNKIMELKASGEDFNGGTPGFAKISMTLKVVLDSAMEKYFL